VLFPGCRILAVGPSRLIYALDFVDFFYGRDAIMYY
jgi:hypothetical protein